MLKNLPKKWKKKDLEIEKLYQENKKQSQDIENLEERVGFLEEDCENLKDTINKIKFRDLSKNFLKCFNQYLTNEDLEFIKDNKDLRGEIISNRIGILYPNDDKEKMKVIKNWVKSSSDLINEGNCLSHSITISEYENKIEYYKQEKNLEQVK